MNTQIEITIIDMQYFSPIIHLHCVLISQYT